MNVSLELLLLIALVVVAVSALEAPNVLGTIAAMSIFSLLSALTYAKMGAPDVAFTEVAVGAGVTGIYLIITVYYLGKEKRM